MRFPSRVTRNEETKAAHSCGTKHAAHTERFLRYMGARADRTAEEQLEL